MTQALHQLAIVTVTYHPDIADLHRQMMGLPPYSAWVIVDNASSKTTQDLLQALSSARPNTYLIRNEINQGLAAAINLGAIYVRDHIKGNKYLLLMDQDSIPTNQAVEKLLDAYSALHEQTPKVGCIGPRLIDVSTGLQHGFHQIRRLRWVRVFPEENSRHPINCTNLNGSGTLTETEFFLNIGGLESNLFIDHADTEWAFRVLNSGRLLYGIPWATFEHSMGEKGLRFWFFGWRVWPQRSPVRHYYLFRNAVWLIQRNYVPGVWKFWAVIKLLATFIGHGLFDRHRLAQLRCMLNGLRCGVNPNYAKSMSDYLQ